MVKTETPKAAPKRPRRVKLRVVVEEGLLYDNVLRAKDEVYWCSSDDVPAEHIAVPVDPSTELGLPPPLTPEQQRQEAAKPPPSWTTKGFVDAANRRRGQLEEAETEAD